MWQSAGSFQYEPAGSVDTLQCVEDGTHMWFRMYDALLHLDAAEIESVSDGPDTARRLPRPSAKPRACLPRTSSSD